MQNPDNDKLSLLIKYYEIATQKHSMYFQVLTQTYSIGVSGIILLFIIALQHIDKTQPFFVLIPFMFLGWQVFTGWQTAWMVGLDLYKKVIEEEIRSQTGMLMPCWDSRMDPIIDDSWRFRLMFSTVAIVGEGVYIATVWQAMIYLRANYNALVWAPSLFVYIVLPICLILASAGYVPALKKESLKLRSELEQASHQKREAS